MPQELMGADTELEKRLHLAETERDLYASDAKRCWEHMPDLANSDADYELHEAVHQLVQERNELRVKVNSYKLSADVQTLNEVRKQYVNLREHQFAEWLRVIYLEAL
jgi:phage-related minor tail protein